MDLSDAEIPPIETPPPTPARLSFPLPGDYYSAPVEARPLVASWVPFGCGGAALLFLVVLFVGGSFVSSGGIAGMIDFAFGTLESEVERMFAADVTPAQRAAFASEMKTTRENIRTQKIGLKDVEPLMTVLKDASEDKLVNAAETGELMTALRKANAEAAKPKPPKKKGE